MSWLRQADACTAQGQNGGTFTSQLHRATNTPVPSPPELCGAGGGNAPQPGSTQKVRGKPLRQGLFPYRAWLPGSKCPSPALSPTSHHSVTERWGAGEGTGVGHLLPDRPGLCRGKAPHLRGFPPTPAVQTLGGGGQGWNLSHPSLFH